MNKLLSLKGGLALLASLLLVCLMAPVAHAGQWEIEDYFWSGSSTSAEVRWAQDDHGNHQTLIQKQSFAVRDQSYGTFTEITPHTAYVQTSGLGDYYGTYQKGIAKFSGEIGSSVYARIKWRRNTTWTYDDTTNDYSEFPDPNDNPPSYIYVRENASVIAYTNIVQQHRNPTGYTYARPWMGDYYEIKASGMDSGLVLGERFRPYYDTANSWQYGPNYKTVIRKIAVSGDYAVVPSRTFAGEIKLSPGYEREYADQYTKASLGFSYRAEPLNFSLNASVTAVADRKQTNSSTEEIDALVQLRWLSPDNIETGENGEDKIVPSRNQARGFWTDYLGGENMDDGAPIPYFAGQATFTASATRSDGRTPIYDSQIYKWTPKDNTDPFDPDGNGTPGFVASSPSQRTYVWNFGSASEGAENFPKTSSVTVEINSDDPNDNTGGSLTATKKINWYTTWSPTKTGFQKNVVTSQFGQYVLPDGSPIAISEVKEGDTIMCFVQGDPGFSTDGGRVEKIRPVPFVDQVPGPGERIEPRVVGRIVPTGESNQIIVFKSTPQVNPDDNPDEAGFDEIQQTREIQATYIQTKEVGRQSVTAALNLYVEAAKFVSIGRLEGWGIEGAINGVVALGKLGTAVREAKAGIVLMDEGAIVLRNRLKAVESLQKDARYSISQRAKFAEDALSLRKSLAREEQLARDTRSMVAKSESYIAKASAEIDNPRGITEHDLLRSHPTNRTVTAEEELRLTQVWESFGGDPSKLRFNQGNRTGFVDETGLVQIRGDIFPNPDGLSVTARLDERIAMAHELGHVHTAHLNLPVGSWQDEWNAGRWAIENIPTLTKDEKITLIEDALDKARTQQKGTEFLSQLSDSMKALLYGQ